LSTQAGNVAPSQTPLGATAGKLERNKLYFGCAAGMLAMMVVQLAWWESWWFPLR
jgi:hypothetical protein